MTIVTRSDADGVDLTTQTVDERGNVDLFGSATGATGELYPSDCIDTSNPVIENLDPERRRIRPPSRPGLVGRLVRRWFGWLIHKPTREELDLKREQERRAREFSALRADGMVCMRYMTGAFDRLGLCWIKRNSDGDIKRINHIKFDCLRVEPDALHLHVDMHKLPWGVSLPQLTSQETLDNLGASVGRAVACRYTPETGIWYTVERASGRAGIPNHVAITDMWNAQPPSASALSFPVGVTHNARRRYADLSRMIHVLIGGTTGSGKTNFLHGIICTLIQRNAADALRLVLVDLKGGLAFSRYEGIPHLMVHPEFNPEGIITDRENVFKLLAWLITEGERRMATLKESGAEDIGQYNSRKRRGRLPYIVVVIDEWADMMQTDKKQAEGALVNVVQRMRSVGMHVILATQVPKSEVITGLIKGNLPARFAFSVPNVHASMAIIDNRNAVGIQPVGRVVMQFTEERQIQTPYISVEQVRDVVRQLITGERGDQRTHDVTPREVMEWALENNDGWLSIRPLWSKYKERKITQAELMGWVDDWEGNTYVVNASEYQVIRAIKPNTGSQETRRLVAVENTEAEQ